MYVNVPQVTFFTELAIAAWLEIITYWEIYRSLCYFSLNSAGFVVVSIILQFGEEEVVGWKELFVENIFYTDYKLKE